MLTKFRRVDGVEFEVDEASASFELMARDGSFTRIGVETSAAETDEAAVDRSGLSKKQLFEEAAKLGVPVTEQMTKAEIVAEIEARTPGE